MEVLDPYSLLDEIWEVPIPEGFKPLSLAKFDGRGDPYEHVAFMNTQMAIIEALDYMKWKLFYLSLSGM